jgi:hypothetical protein
MRTLSTKQGEVTRVSLSCLSVCVHVYTCVCIYSAKQSWDTCACMRVCVCLPVTMHEQYQGMTCMLTYLHEHNIYTNTYILMHLRLHKRAVKSRQRSNYTCVRLRRVLKLHKRMLHGFWNSRDIGTPLSKPWVV